MRTLKLTDQLPTPLPSGSIQFFDGYFPRLPPTIGQIEVTHTVSGQETSAYKLQQSFAVKAPEFVISQGIVQSCYPPDGAADTYDEDLPYVVLTDPSLPWERNLVPGGGAAAAPDPGSPMPWLALLVFAEGEIYLQPGTNSPVATGTVNDLVTPDPNGNVLKPTFVDGWFSQQTQDSSSSPCQWITVTGAAFTAVAPQTTDLPYLAHCRAVSTEQENALLSVLLSNRLAGADTRQTPAAPLRYYAHLVSLEGFGAHLGPQGTPIPTKPDGSGPMDVQLASLYNWTFVSLPETGLNFQSLVQGLISSEAATASLCLPAQLPEGAPPLPQAVIDRLGDGYAPLTFITGTGETSFAWYRGPFTPVVPQPLPQVGAPPTDVSQATSADALMIYLAEQGLFDLSYAAAWNIGRELALSDSHFTQAVGRYRVASNTVLGRLSQRLSMPFFAGQSDLKRLAAPHAARARFAQRIGEGLGRTWTEALDSVRAGARPTGTTAYRRTAAARRNAISPRETLALPGAAAAVTENVQELLDVVADWLANLSLLRSVPFSHLVPDPDMLPPESIRFFYVDQGWIDSAVAGALSIAMHSSADVALLSACRGYLNTAIGSTAKTGMLIRSQLISGWPSLVISATSGGAPVSLVRNECLSPTVRMCLFQGIPDTVTLSEPYQGLHFGVESGGIYPRCVTSPSIGAQLANVAPVLQRTPAPGAIGGVLQVEALAQTLATAAGVTPFDSSCVVEWNGTALVTSVVNERQLSATVPANLVSTAGTAQVTVVTGSVTSAPVTFTVEGTLNASSLSAASPGGTAQVTVTPQPAIGLLTPSSVVAGSAGFNLIVTSGFGSGDYALQIVRAPESQSFTVQVDTGRTGQPQ